jgi:hypothetical protein
MKLTPVLVLCLLVIRPAIGEDMDLRSRAEQFMNRALVASRLTTPMNIRTDVTFSATGDDGIATAGSYVRVRSVDNALREDFVLGDYYGSPSVVSTDAGFTIKRSAGPNKYGEQNFRITLADAKSTPVKIMAESSGDFSKAQVALRWGHPDFNDHAEFKLWTVKPGPAQPKLFTLNDQKSEFEIQTEDGTGTGYHISIWIDVGSGFSTQPSIRIIHNMPHHDFDTGKTDITFTPSNGNIYGELNVDVDAPWVQPPASAPPPPFGWAGTVKVCNFSGNATLHLEAHLLTPQTSNATGAMTMPSTGATAENDPVTFALQADGSAVGQYMTSKISMKRALGRSLPPRS